MNPVRVRFAPSPTGPLHIGGLRTALYNYLLARRTGGTFILRIEDTDQKRYVEGAEDYIMEALEWCGISPDESPRKGGNYGPYRQSERRDIYARYVKELLDNGSAYLAFDTEEELTERREQEKAAGNHNFRYDASTRDSMRNSLSLSEGETKALLEAKTPHVVRFRIDPGETVSFTDTVREEVSFQSNELGDQVLMKADGLPTYHLANIVDDHLMEITHVIRGEEWLPSTALHVLLYRAFGWEAPVFAHLPLLLNPNGKGKLSKRKGADLGFPVFPLEWNDPVKEETFAGFREDGYLPEAVVNFLSLLGWNPGTEQEVFSLEELTQAFSLDRITKSGARFDIEKGKWFNQQYLIATDDAVLAPLVLEQFAAAGHTIDLPKATTITGLLKERVHLLPEFVSNGSYFVGPVTEYEEKPIRKKWKPDNRAAFNEMADDLTALSDWSAATIKETVVAFMGRHELGFGAVLPIIRVAVSGSVQGPDAFEILEAVGREESVTRLRKGYDAFDAIKAA
ncbi:glutamate--tRNA ligase [Neolewinella agarilytica]|uniref:Glutamate--tRNA ligase n=1 Tax=Neolewinella agarilytica TaxID=478744 RepID=A0A1H9BPS2_9BACT|nr:glutamate--tRNA ligase [Neolewinella agarilytica]SEP90980.1 glutamyl-tRNA synthetase [Neolewinella agarilytica]